VTDTEKQRECERICGDAGKRGMHSAAPERCPILDQQWKNPPRKKGY
jgi:hypothetical protein